MTSTVPKSEKEKFDALIPIHTSDHRISNFIDILKNLNELPCGWRRDLIKKIYIIFSTLVSRKGDNMGKETWDALRTLPDTSGYNDWDIALRNIIFCSDRVIYQDVNSVIITEMMGYMRLIAQKGCFQFAYQCNRIGYKEMLLV